MRTIDWMQEDITRPRKREAFIGIRWDGVRLLARSESRRKGRAPLACVERGKRTNNGGGGGGLLVVAGRAHDGPGFSCFGFRTYLFPCPATRT